MLANKYDKTTLKARLDKEDFKRTTLSFYRYTQLEPETFRDVLYKSFDALQIFGRVYVAQEGINAQISVPNHHFEQFKELLQSVAALKNMPLKIAVADDCKSFYKLIVRVKHKIVADGLGEIDFSDVGNHINAAELNKALDNPETVIIDMRNHYESEIGHFEGALCPDADTFREALPQAIAMAADKKDKKIILYCTGGIRCEKAGAYFKQHGFTDVNQLHGGIIAYAAQIKEQGLTSKFIGKNFVFDDRLGERITEDVISKCHQCGQPCDTHTNCKN
ncbi:MAG TPA: rhodanese-related sulfurtransferase, partial [Bacteroidia bacterium]|nr:rhodanese-related sulfurtransferase [Bacteroidia bacterium]